MIINFYQDIQCILYGCPEAHGLHIGRKSTEYMILKYDGEKETRG